MRRNGRAQYRKTCEACGAEYVTTRGEGRFCSRICAWSVKETRQCESCGGDYEAPALNLRTRYCSKRCSKAVERHQRRAKTRGAEADEIMPVEVFDRDGWRCGICGGVVGKTYRYPHPRSASLDHIVPLSDGGGHTMDNVQCSHLECNVRKSNTGPGQLLLIG